MAGAHRPVVRWSPPRGRARVAALATIPLAVVLGAGVALSLTGHMPAGMPGSSLTTANLAATNSNTRVPDLAEIHPNDPMGNPISLHQTPAEAANSMNCTLIVPGDPLSAQGLATPWQLGDGCDEANPNLAAFVEATILAPSGAVSVYDPLVITEGTTPAITPTPPTIPAGAQVIIDTGFNGNNLVLEGQGALQGNCIDAFGGSIIAQTAACDAAAFYNDANAQIAAGTLKIPALGIGRDGQPCPTTRDFSLIDQDQSDNVLSVYLVTASGQIAQASPNNIDVLNGATILTNGSDDGLVGHFVDPALGCQKPSAPNTTAPGGADDSQALNELTARQDQKAPIALLPVNDPQLLLNGKFSVGKTNTYRALTDQPLLPTTTNADQNAETYCQQMVNVAPTRLQLDVGFEAGIQSPVPTLGNNLATFMGARLSASFGNLNCTNFGLTNPVMLSLNGAGVAIAVTYNTTRQTAHSPVPGGGPTPSPTPSSSATPSPTPSATQPSPTPSATEPSPTPSPSPTLSWPGY
jgi:cell division septation protein DedD